MYLKKPTEEDIPLLLEFKKEMNDQHSQFDGCCLIEKFEDISEWIHFVSSFEKKETMPKGYDWVEAEEYLSFNEQNQLIGMINLRLGLNSFLLNEGGSIGYCIRPFQRNKGYAKEQLKLGLKKMKEKGFEKVLLTCDKDNIASSKTIQSQNGILENEHYSSVFHSTILRYWIYFYFQMHGNKFQIKQLLGHGKGGYSFLVEDAKNQLFTLKKMHHEPCDYYQFGNKIQAEKNDYERLKETGIHIPQLIDIDEEQEIILKEYIHGETIQNEIQLNKSIETFLPQIEKIQSQCHDRNLNIDYYPTNFIDQEGVLYYIDYECNIYSDEWNYDNWGKKYWLKGATNNDKK